LQLESGVIHADQIDTAFLQSAWERELEHTYQSCINYQGRHRLRRALTETDRR
jgi:hypothetical protein